VISKRGMAILEKYGFTPVQNATFEVEVIASPSKAMA
jgi:hypothetical protein